jgi:hypothetical protein
VSLYGSYDTIRPMSDRQREALLASQGRRKLSREIIKLLSPQEADDYRRCRSIDMPPLEALRALRRLDILEMMGTSKGAAVPARKVSGLEAGQRAGEPVGTVSPARRSA